MIRVRLLVPTGWRPRRTQQERYLSFYAHELFGERVISKGLWSPTSPDLSPCDFFFGGHFKNRIFQNEIPTIEKLKRLIAAKINAITSSQLKKLFNNLMKRVALCKGELGTHA